LLGAGAIAYAQAVSIDHRLLSGDPTVGASLNSVVQGGKTAQVIAFGAAGTGVACLGAAAVLWLRGEPAPVSVSLALGPHGGGIEVGSSFW